MNIRLTNLRQIRSTDDLKLLAARRLSIEVTDIRALTVLRTTVDARGRRPVRVLNLDLDVAHAGRVLARHSRDAQVGPVPQPKGAYYEGPKRRLGSQPLVVGTGPAGLFLTLALLDRGYKPIVIERGKALRSRWQDVNAYWNRGELQPESNVVYGDGGAGTFSDGKLTTRRNDPRNTSILATFADLAKAPDILTAGKPHLGTNRLSRALLAVHERFAASGIEVQFEHRLEDLVVEGGRVVGAVVNGMRIDTDAVFLATGHSARDVYRILERHEVAMEARPFAVGARAEHPQAMINRAQTGRDLPLEPADYLLAYNDRERGRSSYTFCMCPGGEVVAAGTEHDGLTVNGMSYSHRADRFANAAVVVTVNPEDYGGEGPLAGLEFQRRLEAAAYQAGGGGHVAPAQRIGDFLEGSPSSGPIDTSYRRGVNAGPLIPLLPEVVTAYMRRGLRHFGRRIRGYDSNDGVLIGLETRTSSPVRVLRDPQSYESVNLPGLVPLGEGAGYAGGIMSSASDGLRAAERIKPMHGE